MFAANGLRATWFVAKRLHATRPRVVVRASLRPNSFASAPVGIVPAHASTVATATDAITRFDPAFRPRRSSFVRAIVVKDTSSSIRSSIFQHPSCGSSIRPFVRSSVRPFVRSSSVKHTRASTPVRVRVHLSRSARRNRVVVVHASARRSSHSARETPRDLIEISHAPARHRPGVDPSSCLRTARDSSRTFPRVKNRASSLRRAA
jgi:hypothetical protein